MKDERICEEKDEGGQIYYRLILSDGTIACTIQMLRFSSLQNIVTHPALRRKRYGTRLFEHVANIAKRNGERVISIAPPYIESSSKCAVGFFRAMGFKLRPAENNPQFLEGEKVL